MKSKCLRGKKPIEFKVDENQTLENIEFLICILAKNLYSLSLPVKLFIWRDSDSVWLSYSSHQDEWWWLCRGDDSFGVCPIFFLCNPIQINFLHLPSFYNLTEIFQIPTRKNSVFNDYKAMTSFFFPSLSLKNLSKNQPKCFYAMLGF